MHELRTWPPGLGVVGGLRRISSTAACCIVVLMTPARRVALICASLALPSGTARGELPFADEALYGDRLEEHYERLAAVGAGEAGSTADPGGLKTD